MSIWNCPKCGTLHGPCPYNVCPTCGGALTWATVSASLSVSRETPGGTDESPIFAFQAWVARYVVAFGRLLTQDEYAIAQSAFFAAHPGQGPTSALMGAPGGTGDRGEQLVKCVARRELEPRILMLCPFAAGVSVEEYDGMPDVPDRWACTCGAEHGFSVDDCEIQFRRPVPPGASVEPPAAVSGLTRFAWLMERRLTADAGDSLNTPKGTLVYWDGGHAESFVTDANKAVQFCRREDALRIAPSRHYAQWGWQVIEHGFVGAAVAGPLTALVEKWRVEVQEITSDGDFCCAKTREHDADELAAALSLSLQDQARFREALANLVGKLDEMFASPEYLGTFMLAVVHGATYNGPTCQEELNEARALLRDPETATPMKDERAIP